ncbi:general secretion pathway protein H, PulJ [Methylophaga aminisulfidivorans MP]|uniref:General secretion pathway protein H, PulJ n=2 Tax=Methylophaga TaxID=40222 RepID=F5SUX2_9GAMM|nr:MULTISPECIES: prepilin-type N-terminal cleavage/methylation domain-containing protein [Methylophaga]EGL55558.1 general secretion pathway protein H, PulJ [Methylophaga aminisulfidivorans MP]
MKQRGFSLLELLVAFSLMSVSLVILFQLYAKGQQVIRLGNDYNVATTIAESLIAQATYQTSGTQQSGITEKQFHWQLTIQPTNGNMQSKLPLREVSANVSWQRSGKPYHVHLSTLVPVSKATP